MRHGSEPQKANERRWSPNGAPVRGSFCGYTLMWKPTGTDNRLIKNLMSINEVFSMLCAYAQQWIRQTLTCLHSLWTGGIKRWINRKLHYGVVGLTWLEALLPQPCQVGMSPLPEAPQPEWRDTPHYRYHCHGHSTGLLLQEAPNWPCPRVSPDSNMCHYVSLCVIIYWRTHLITQACIFFYCLRLPEQCKRSENSKEEVAIL